MLTYTHIWVHYRTRFAHTHIWAHYRIIFTPSHIWVHYRAMFTPFHIWVHHRAMFTPTHIWVHYRAMITPSHIWVHHRAMFTPTHIRLHSRPMFPPTYIWRGSRRRTATGWAPLRAEWTLSLQRLAGLLLFLTLAFFLFICPIFLLSESYRNASCSNLKICIVHPHTISFSHKNESTKIKVDTKVLR